MKKFVSTLAIGAVLATASFASNAAALYAPCAGCHGKDGSMKALNASKIIKDMTKEDFVASLKGYKDGTYGGAMKGVMTGQVAKLSEDDMKALADLIIK
jgi:cytochrome c553